MENGYVDDLFFALRHTVFRNANGGIEEYSDGISLLLDMFSKHKENGSKLFFIGNGGSAAIASHMTADFMKNGGMRTVDMYGSSVATCISNDYGYDHIFSKQLEFMARTGDLLVAISSSGNSENIVNGIMAGKKQGAEVITFTGFNRDNKCGKMGDFNVYVPCYEYGKVETIHVLILQQIVDLILERDGVCGGVI